MDTAGHEIFHSLIPSFIRDSSVDVIVYDAASKASVKKVQVYPEILLSVQSKFYLTRFITHLLFEKL